MLLSTSGMARVHRLREISLDLIKISEEGLERVEQTKLLSVHLHELLKWDQHVKKNLFENRAMVHLVYHERYFPIFILGNTWLN